MHFFLSPTCFLFELFLLVHVSCVAMENEQRIGHVFVFNVHDLQEKTDACEHTDTLRALVRDQVRLAVYIAERTQFVGYPRNVYDEAVGDAEFFLADWTHERCVDPTCREKFFLGRSVQCSHEKEEDDQWNDACDARGIEHLLSLVGRVENAQEHELCEYIRCVSDFLLALGPSGVKDSEETGLWVCSESAAGAAGSAVGVERGLAKQSDGVKQDLISCKREARYNWALFDRLLKLDWGEIEEPTGSDYCLYAQQASLSERLDVHGRPLRTYCFLKPLTQQQRELSDELMGDVLEKEAASLNMYPRDAMQKKYGLFDRVDSSACVDACEYCLEEKNQKQKELAQECAVQQRLLAWTKREGAVPEKSLFQDS